MKRRKFLQDAVKTAVAVPFFNNVLRKDGFIEHDSGKDLNQINAADPYPQDFFFRPEHAWAADFIPFYSRGEFQLFYLHDWRNTKEHGEGISWNLISTKDFVHYTNHGEVLPHGTTEEQDLLVFTGSVIEAQGQFHIFYTGENPHFPQQGKPLQGIMHAVSDDLYHWKKVAGQLFYAPSSGIYEQNDWRDAFVFWDDDTQKYNMLLAARYKKGIPRRRGLTALCSSADLNTWKVKEPFYAPDLYYTHECPDLFKMGDWWYLVFSEFTDLYRTRYRMSRSLQGPWLAPERDDFDGHALYATKTATDGKKRFLFGWNPTRSGDTDFGNWQWGGNLIVHELHQEPNGELTVRVPESVAGAFNKPVEHVFHSSVGHVTTDNDIVHVKSPGIFSASITQSMPYRCKIETTIIFEKGTKSCGLMLRTSDDYEQTYYIRLEPPAHRLVFDLWPRKTNDVPFMPELERKIKLLPGVPVRIQMLIDGTVGTLYMNNKIAMSFRLYNHRNGAWGVFAEEGNAIFRDITVSIT